MTGNKQKIVIALGIAVCILLLAVAAGRTRFSTSVVDLLPGRDVETRILRELANESQGKLLTVRLYSNSRQVTDESRNVFIRELQKKGSINKVWRTGQEGLKEAGSQLFSNRYFWLLPGWFEQNIGPAWHTKPINTGELAEVIVANLENYLNSPDGMALVDLVPRDPFLLMDNLNKTLPFSSDSGKKGETMLWVEQMHSPFRESGQENVFRAFNEALEAARVILPDLQMEYTGVALFAHASKAGMKAEIQRLNFLGIILVVLVTLVSVRKFAAMGRIALVVFLALLIAVTSVVTIFDSVHVIALVIGSILTGIAVDYGFHLILHDRYCLPSKDTRKAVIAGSLSSALGFLVLVGAPLPFLRQVGVFVGFGLVAALMVALLLGSDRDRKTQVKAWQFRPGILPTWTSIVLLVMAFPGLFMLNWQSNIKDLEFPLPGLKERDQRLNSLASPTMGVKTYLVYAENLVRARSFLTELDPGNQFRHAGLILPDLKRIQKAQAVAQQLPQFRESLNRTLENNGYYPDAFHAFFSDWEHYKQLSINEDLYNEKIQAFSANLPGPLKAMIHAGQELSWFMLLASDDLDYELKANVLELNQADMLSRAFSEYGRIMFLYATFCLIVLVVSVCAYMGIPSGLKAIFVPVAASIIAFGIIGAWSGSIGLFHLIGGMLAFCISLDYGIFAETSNRVGKKMPKSITVSSITTLAVFGILATSQIPGVRQLAITIILVVLCALLVILCRWPWQKSRNLSAFSLIPHGPEARMVDRILEVDDNSILASCSPNLEQSVPVECLVEAMAQCAALLLAQNRSEGEPRSGMLVVVQTCNPVIAVIHPNQVVRASVSLGSEAIEDLVQFQGKCLDKHGNLLIESRFSIFIPPPNTQS